ncbi:hypothetical protein KC878_01670 [Candidatus Saccharibacteria bacterium]|nr:hypothetical protein [Candidatus Saccharibacteria bacterium]MCB9821681.1 hypothetical protein [Candidatus Nomurabacteria bacterium]
MTTLQNLKAKDDLFARLGQEVSTYPATIRHFLQAAENLSMPKAIHAALNKFHNSTIFHSAEDFIEKIQQVDLLEQAELEAPDEEVRSLQW